MRRLPALIDFGVLIGLGTRLGDGTVEYMDQDRLIWALTDPNPERPLRIFEGNWARHGFHFGYYTEGLEETFVAFVGSSHEVPILALGLRDRLAVKEERAIPSTVIHGSSCTGDMAWCLADHLGQRDLLPRTPPLLDTREDIQASALYGLQNMMCRSTGQGRRRIIIGEEICSANGREESRSGDPDDPPGLIIYPVMVLRACYQAGLWTCS